MLIFPYHVARTFLCDMTACISTHDEQLAEEAEYNQPYINSIAEFRLVSRFTGIAL